MSITESDADGAGTVPSRRDFIKTGAAGLAGSTIAMAACRTGSATTGPRAVGEGQGPLVGDGRKRRILLRGGVVLTFDPKVGDFENADVLIDGKTIAQIGPNLSDPDAEVVDCSGTIVMPGFITTHHHQYETLQRSIIADGLLAQPWPME